MTKVTLGPLLAAAFITGCGRPGSSRLEAPAHGTGAVTTIVPTEADARVARVEDLLHGRVPGLEVRPLPDGSYTLRIRGQHSIRGNPTDEEPLLVIDGTAVPQGSLASALAGIAPRDVARIDVLKDAAATGFYGARGANGVIVVTTKRAP